MIVRASPVQRYRLLTVFRGLIPLFQRVFHAAFEVIGLGLAAGLGKRTQDRQRLVRFAGLQGRSGLGKRQELRGRRKDRG